MNPSSYAPRCKHSFADPHVPLEVEEELVPGIPNPMAAVQQVMARMYEESESTSDIPVANAFSCAAVLRRQARAHHRTRAQHGQDPFKRRCGPRAQKRGSRIPHGAVS